MAADSKDIHVIPIGDLLEHVENPACWCSPSVKEIERRVLVIHNSADGRELVEEHGLQ